MGALRTVGRVWGTWQVAFKPSSRLVTDWAAWSLRPTHCYAQWMTVTRCANVFIGFRARQRRVYFDIRSLKSPVRTCQSEGRPITWWWFQRVAWIMGDGCGGCARSQCISLSLVCWCKSLAQKVSPRLWKDFTLLLITLWPYWSWFLSISKNGDMVREEARGVGTVMGYHHLLRRYNMGTPVWYRTVIRYDRNCTPIPKKTQTIW